MAMFANLQDPIIQPRDVSQALGCEIHLTNDLKTMLEKAIEVEGKRLRVMGCTSYFCGKKSQNIVFPNQYYSIAAGCYDFAMALAKYCDFFDEKVKSNDRIVDAVKSSKNLDEVLNNPTFNSEIHSLLAGDTNDITFFIEFLKGGDFRPGKKIINFRKKDKDEEDEKSEEDDDAKIRSAKDFFGSCILKKLNIPDASSGFLGDLVYYLSGNDLIYQKLKNSLLGETTKKELYRDKNKVGFFRYVLQKTLESDQNLSKLNWKLPKGKSPINIKIGKLLAGRRKDQPPRDGNCDESIHWDYKGVTYCANNELEPAHIKQYFFPEYNDAYKGVFSLEHDAKSDEFIMYEFVQAKTKEGKRLQKIIYGAPGTGKSFKIDDQKNGFGLKDIPRERKFRTTFHPDYDYGQFVGVYKPIPKYKPNNSNTTTASDTSQSKETSSEQQNEISYSFVPQVFAKAYVAAWKSYLSDNIEDVFLVIEEINRGNCAQIFGDIFQLLDRDENGFSQYSIDADTDFAHWLKTDKNNGLGGDVWDKYNSERHVQDSKIALPPNFNILATMNTSDQSLFPMDCAFKRRFDWEYVPIRYEAQKNESGEKIDKNWNADEFEISFKYKDKEEIKDCVFYWINFLKKVNADVYKVTESEDKQMGEFFIKPKNKEKVISLEEFRSKVLFYLWDSVYKDETDKNIIFHFKYPDDNGSVVTFQRLFEDDFGNILLEILKRLDNAYKGDDFKDFKILKENS